MYGYEDMADRRPVSRSDKIREAKSAFGQEAGRAAGGYGRGTSNAYSDRREPMPAQEEEPPFGMLRMVVAGLLLFAFVAAFHFQVSYHGFNKESVKEALADESHWNGLVNQVVQVMNTIQKEGTVNKE